MLCNQVKWSQNPSRFESLADRDTKAQTDTRPVTRLSETCRSGRHAQQIEKNIKNIQETTDRFDRLDEYGVKGEATVKFNVASSTISKEDKEQLKKLAETAISLNGYIIEVKGFADSTGRGAMNERLSEDRAKAVIGYLMRECNVPVWRIVAPGAMGEFQPAASNESASGRAENRRVEVKILVNKGVAGS